MDLVQERKIKRDKVAAYLAEHGLEAVVLGRRCNFAWYACGVRNYVNIGSDTGNSWVVAGKDSACVVTSNIEATRLRQEELAGTGIEVVEFAYHDPATREQAFLRAIGGRKAAADSALPALTLPPLAKDFDRLRWQLTEGEIERYRVLCSDTAEAVEFVAGDLSPGCTEHEVAGMLAGAVRCFGALPWVLLVAADGRMDTFRHPLPTDQVIDSRVLLAVCAERGGLISPCTRLVQFGALPTELEAKHRAVATVDAALISATRPGAALGDIFAQAQAAYAAVGFADEWRLHHQGGSTGYLPREVTANPTDRTVALANQPFAWNPSITGTKSEDTVLCTPEGGQVLAGKSNWPMVEAVWQGARMARPAILVR